MTKKPYSFSPQLMMPWHPGKTISAARAAELLGCCKTTIHSMIQDGTLEAFKRRKHRPNSHYLVLYESVCRVAEEWRQEAGVLPSPSTPTAQSKQTAQAVPPRRS